MTVEFEALYATLQSPVMPEWIKVESPMTATVFPAFSGFARLNPWIPETDAPMQRTASTAERGGWAPSV